MMVTSKQGMNEMEAVRVNIAYFYIACMKVSSLSQVLYDMQWTCQ